MEVLKSEGGKEQERRGLVDAVNWQRGKCVCRQGRGGRLKFGFHEFSA